MSASYPFDDHGKSILMDARYMAMLRYMPTKSLGDIGCGVCWERRRGINSFFVVVGIGLSATVHDLLRADWYHPTLSEIWTYPLEDLAEEIVV